MSKIVKYEMKLHVQTPLHIGGVDYKTKLTTKEYVYIPKSSTLCIMDHQKLISCLEKKGKLEEYINYISNHDNKDNLNVFLSKNISIKESTECNKRIYKNLDVIGRNNKQKKSLNDINLYVRDVYDSPYIPGSSIKGGIRTLLLVGYLSNKNNKTTPLVIDAVNKLKNIINKTNVSSRDSRRDSRKEIKKIIKSLEEEIVFTKTDKFSNKKNNVKKFGVSISDTYNENINQKGTKEIKTNFYQDIDQSVIKKEKLTYMPNVREYIENGHDFNFNITLDFDLLENSKLNIKSYDEFIGMIEKGIDYFNERFFKQNNLATQESVSLSKSNLILGGNTGFHQKTILYSLLEDKNDLLKIIKIILHEDGNKTRNHKGDIATPRILNGIRKNNKFTLTGLVYIEKKEEKIVGEKNASKN